MHRPRRAPVLARLLATTAALPAAGCALQADAQELIARERALVEAVRTRNGATLEELLAPEFRVVAVEGRRPVTRAEWLTSVLFDGSFDRIDASRPEVESVGEHLAAVEVRLVYRGGARDPDGVVRREAVTDLWVERDGRWLVLQRVRRDLGTGS